MLLQSISDTLKHVSTSFVLLGAIGLIQFGIFNVLTHYSSKLYEDFGAKSPETQFGYSPKEYYEILDTWGIQGCNAYLNTAILRFFYIPTYVTLLCAVLWRSLHKAAFDTSATAQLAAAILIADYGETAILALACLQYPQKLESSLIAVADLCNKVKVVSIVFAVISIFALVTIKSYLMPFLVLTKAAGGETQQPTSTEKDWWKKKDTPAPKKKD